MDIHNFFLILFLILISARILGEVFARIGIPSVVGELSADILLGVSGLGIIEVNDVLKVLAEIGIILLLFEVGLETDLKRLKEAGLKSLTVALFGAIFPFVLSPRRLLSLRPNSLCRSVYRRYTDSNKHRNYAEGFKRHP